MYTFCPHRFCTAPLMEWSDRHCRYLWRLLSKRTRLYTEMVTSPALIHGDREKFLAFHPDEQPVALQVGGSNKEELAQCARLAEEWGYSEVNLNCGCPSDRVQNGMIGACLMAHPQLVADCIKAMQDASSIPITIKHRIGIDDMEDYSGLFNFVEKVAATGCNTFIVHARKAWLQGLSPKENREVPPLRYELVHQLKRERPELNIIINGGINSLADAKEHLSLVDGVMIGREAYHNPFFLADVDKQLFGDASNTKLDRATVFKKYMEYCKNELAQGTRLHHMTKHVLGLFHGQKGGRAFRRHISEHVHRPGAGIAVMEDAFSLVQ